MSLVTASPAWRVGRAPVAHSSPRPLEGPLPVRRAPWRLVGRARRPRGCVCGHGPPAFPPCVLAAKCPAQAPGAPSSGCLTADQAPGRGCLAAREPRLVSWGPRLGCTSQQQATEAGPRANPSAHRAGGPGLAWPELPTGPTGRPGMQGAGAPGWVAQPRSVSLALGVGASVCGSLLDRLTWTLSGLGSSGRTPWAPCACR